MSELNLEEKRKQLFAEMGLPVNISFLALAERHKQTLEQLSQIQIESNQARETMAEMSVKLCDKDKLIQDLKSRLAKYEQPNDSSETISTPVNAASKIVPTSNNSSVPPSKNPIGVKHKHTKSLREKSGKKPGGQPGHKGATYSVPADNVVTNVKKWYPAGDASTHSGCYEGATRYVIDISNGIYQEITMHISMCRKDVDGKILKGEFPSGVNSYVSYGPNLAAFVVFLNTYMNIPFNKLGTLLNLMFGIDIDNGTISNILNKMKKLCKKSYDLIRDNVAGSRIVGADESGIDVNGKNYWIWAFQTKQATFLAVDQHRGREVIKDLFEDKELEKMILESDRWGSYFTDDVKFKDHQLCLAHLLRNLIYCSEAFPKEPWSVDMITLLRDSIHRRKTEGTSKELYEEMQTRLDGLLAQKFIEEPKCKEEENTMYKLRASLQKYRDYIFTFLIYPEVRYTNNDSEKALRPAKTKLKVSGCFRSECGAENYAMFGSIIQTSIKNGKHPIEALRLIAQSAYE